MRYDEAMKYITEVGNFGSNYGLERTERLLEILGNPHKDLKLIHIAGTNGKGSTTSIITEILIGAGYKVGMYTSPFIEEFEERIQINRMNIPKNTLAVLMDEIKKAVDKVISEGFNHPTEFEIITVLMFLYFKREEIDFGVIEVGLGGTLDSTNVLKAIVQVITSISYDHTNLLGNTLEKIASEKAGIIKKDIPTILYPQENEAFKVIEKKSKEMNSELTIISKNKGELLDIIDEKRVYQRILIKEDSEYSIDLPLLGEHQIINLLVALEVIKKMNEMGYTNITQEITYNSVEKVVWKGRLEVLKKRPLVVIDGAHNKQGIEALSKNIFKYFKFNKVYLILGILADKEVEDMVKTITPLAEKVYAVTPNSIRAELADDLSKVILNYNKNCKAYEEYEKAYITALEDANNDDLIIISGSLYMIGDMRKIIMKNN